MKAGISIALLLMAIGIVGCSPRSSASEIDSQVIKATSLRSESWNAAIGVAKNPPPPFIAKLEFVASPQFEGRSVDEVVAMLPKNYPYAFVFVADAQALEEKNYPFWCIDLLDEKRPRFRVEARHMASVANNLALANMDFSEFAEAAKKNGVFSGF